MEQQRTQAHVTDPKVMRALAHPARITILEHLNTTDDVVTATQCAELVGLSPSAVSYHLRALAKVGLVEQAPSRGDGRERVWRGTSSGVTLRADADDPQAVDAGRALLEIWLARDEERRRAFLARERDEPREWQSAATFNSSMLLLTADELVRLSEDVQKLMKPYERLGRLADTPAGARTVAWSMSAFPTD